MNWFQKLLVCVFGAMVIVISGCMAWQQGLTPAYIDPAAIEFSEEKPTIFTPYTSLWDAYRIDRALDYKHLKNMKDIERAAEDEGFYYGKLKDAMTINIASAEELRDTIFSPEGGLLSLLLAGSGVGIGAFAISKPSDKKKIEELKNGVKA